MKKLYDVTQPIRSIWFGPEKEWGYSIGKYVTLYGREGGRAKVVVTSIVVYQENGYGGVVAWFEVTLSDGTVMRENSMFVSEVEYETGIDG